MPIGGAGGGSGSGFSLGPLQNEFADNAARDTYATANAAWLALYNGDRSNWIRVGGAAGSIQRRNAAGSAWETVTPIVSGPAGAAGAPTTGPAVVTLLQALTGNGRLNATALRLIAAAIDTELGSTAWRTGGAAQTAAQILALLLTVDGAGSGLDADLLDGMTPAQVAALGGGGGGLTQGQVDARITNRIAPRIFVSTAAFTQTGLNFVNISVAPTTTGAPAAGDVVIFRTPASIVATTGIALGLIIDGIGGNPVYILDRSDGLPLNASDFAVDSIYTSVFDGTNFEIVGPPLSPRMALLGDDGRLSENQMSNRFRRSLPTFAAAAGVTWDPSTHTITATVAGIPSITGGDEVIMGLPAAMPGRDATRALVSINGEAAQLLNSFTGDGRDRVPSHELTPGGILLMYRTGFGYRLLEPHILERAGEWADDVIYLLGQDVTVNGFDYKLLNETSVNQNPETNPTVWLRFPHRWQDEGVTFADAITGVNFAGAGVSGAVAAGVLTLTVPGVTDVNLDTATPTNESMTIGASRQAIAEAIAALTSGGVAWQDEGTARAGVATVNLVGAGVTAAVAGGVLTVTIPGGAAPPTPTHTSYVGVSTDTTITSAEAIAGTSGTGNALAVPTYTGAQHVFFVRPATEGVVTAVYIYAAGSRNTQNQISAWTAIAALDVGGENHVGIFSTAALTGASDLIVEVV